MDLMARRRAMMASQVPETWVPVTSLAYSSYYKRDNSRVSISNNVITFNTAENDTNWMSYVTAQPFIYKVDELTGRFRMRGHAIVKANVRLFACLLCHASIRPNNNRVKFIDVNIVQTGDGFSGEFDKSFFFDMKGAGWNPNQYVGVRWWAYSTESIKDAAVLTAPVLEAVLL